MKYIRPKKPSDYPVFKGMDLQNKKYLISVGTNGIFIHRISGPEAKDCDVEFTYEELYELGQEVMRVK